jgi:dipeptidase E
MPKLYLLGGENVFRRSAKRVNERAFQDAKQPVDVLVFAWARLHFDRKYRKRKLFSDYLNSLGACSVNFVEYSDSKESIEDKMASASLVYLTGGLPSVLIERLKEKGIDRLLLAYSGIIIGRSAGALALCRRCITTVRSSSKAKTVKGLGLADFTLSVHYTTEKDYVLLGFSKQDKVYAVPQNSALVFDNGVLEVLGEAFLFENGQKRSLV